MNNPNIEKLRGVLELFLDHNQRINQKKDQVYWYPLSQATYGIEEILQALDSLCSFRTTMWEKTLEFEKEFARFLDVPYAVMVNSGSSADLLLCELLRFPGDKRDSGRNEILVPSVTWPTQIWSVSMTGFRPVLVDVDPATLNLDINDLENKITNRSCAISIVHLMGNPCDMCKIEKLAQQHGLEILEDCCEALGSYYKDRSVGSFGLGGAFSFFFSHHMMTMEGGMVVCKNEETAARLKMLRAHGWVRNLKSKPEVEQANPEIDPRYAFHSWGYNFRPTDLQAGFGIEQLKKIEKFNERRNTMAEKFFRFIDTIPVLATPAVLPRAMPSWLALPLMVQEKAKFTRKEITYYLETQGIETRPIVAGNLCRQPAAQFFPEFFEQKLPGADKIHERGFYIGLSPMTSDAEMDRLIETFDLFLKNRL